MQIGVARTRLSPPWGVELAGWGYYLGRTWQRVRDHTAATALVLADGGQELVVDWTQSRWGADDLEMWRRQCVLLPYRSPLRPRAEAMVERLDTELGR